MKTCTKCGQAKPLEQFYKSKTGKDGRNSVCIVCHRARQIAYEQEKKKSRPSVSEAAADKLKAGIESAIAELEAGWDPVRLDAYLYKLREDFRARHRERLKVRAAFQAV